MHLGYIVRLLHSIVGIRPFREWPVRVALVVPFALLILSLMLAFNAPGAPPAHKKAAVAADQLKARAEVVNEALRSVDHVVADEVAPLARVLMTYRNDERLARRVATALVREGHRAGVAPDILLAVLLVENPWINPAARSPVGARGLMQVMPGHRGKWRACPGDLESIESNICYGAQIFRAYLREEKGRVEAALLRYNGCVKGTNTPNCHEYPAAVFARAGRAALLAKRVQHTHAAD